VNQARGQALVELAVCMPFVLLLGVGAAGAVEVADAGSGLRAATEAAVTVAARAPDEAAARMAAQSRFAVVISAYPVKSPRLRLVDGGFVRGGTLTATSGGFVDLGWDAVMPAQVAIEAVASMRIDPWRTRW
jgi:hypothetical protein